ncbi:hypothetical protein FOBRF1_012105 [Fusarium oxysporum]
MSDKREIPIEERAELADTAEMEKQRSHGLHEEHLHKVFNIWTASAYQVLMMASWTCNIVLYDTVMSLGGPMMLIYSTIIVGIGQTLVMASLGEMCFVWPYSGGQQAFTKYLAPPFARRFLSYVIGWIVLRWATFLIYAALVLLTLLCSLSQKHLPAIVTLGGVITFAGGIAWGATFLAMAPKQSPEFVFTEFINLSGYTSACWVGIMSFYTPVYALYGTDGILHIAEEMRDAERNAPRAMIWSMLFSAVTSFLGAIIMAFCIGDWEAYMESDETHSLTILYWFIDVLNGSIPGGSAFVMIVIVFLNFLIGVGVNLAGSRLAWGMAGDQALPFSRTFHHIHPKLGTPLNSSLLIIAAEVVIGLVVFGSDYAFQAIVSLGNAAIQLGYLIPILMLVISGRGILPSTRQFNLGRFGLAINIASVCWTTIIVIMLFFPLSVPIDAENILNMNWAVVIIGGVVVLVIIDWFFRGRHHYRIEE